MSFKVVIYIYRYDGYSEYPALGVGDVKGDGYWQRTEGEAFVFPPEILSEEEYACDKENYLHNTEATHCCHAIKEYMGAGIRKSVVGEGGNYAAIKD